MATRIKVTKSPLERVEALVRPHLRYDPTDATYRTIRTLGQIVGTHGADPDDINRLARDGHFSGGSGGEFVITPNVRFSRWNHTEIGRHIGHTIMGWEAEAFQKAIEYAETSAQGQAEAIKSGVVVAFNDRVLGMEPEPYEDVIRQDFELPLPLAPSIDMIEGIYPVDADAAVRLEGLLRALR